MLLAYAACRAPKESPGLHFVLPSCALCAPHVCTIWWAWMQLNVRELLSENTHGALPPGVVSAKLPALDLRLI